MDIVYLFLKSPEYLLHKETDKLDHFFINIAKKLKDPLPNRIDSWTLVCYHW